MLDVAGSSRGRVATRLFLDAGDRTSRKTETAFHNFVEGRLLDDWALLFYPRKPKLLVGKFAKLGKMLGKSPAATPNHDASVAAY
jgi:hypothetical protein